MIDAAAAAALSEQAASTAVCIKIIRVDGRTMGLTDYDTDLNFDGTTFLSTPGATLEHFEWTSDLAPDHGSISTGLCEGVITPADIAAERYARAEVQLIRVDTDDVKNRFVISKGTIGEILRQGEAIRFEFRSQKHLLSTSTGRVYQKSCDAALGDARCGFDLDATSVSAAILNVDGLSVSLSVDQPSPGAFFEGGVLIISSGRLAGLSRPIRRVRAEQTNLFLTLRENLPSTPDPGDLAVLRAGCDKQYATCRDRFSNQRRFRGFSTIPGAGVLAVKAGT